LGFSNVKELQIDLDTVNQVDTSGPCNFLYWISRLMATSALLTLAFLKFKTKS